MSIEKVKRWEVHVERVIGVAGSSYARARPVEHPTGRYIEYADVAWLVAALEKISQLNGGHRSETNHQLNDAHTIARNELARWTA